MSRDFRELGGRDAYALLGLDEGADAQQIKRAWRAMSRRHHADVGGSDNVQSLLNVAYDTLSDPALRGEYDRYRRTVLLVGASPAPEPPDAGPPPAHRQPPSAHRQPSSAHRQPSSAQRPPKAWRSPPVQEPDDEPDEWDRSDPADRTSPHGQHRFESEPEAPRHEAASGTWSAPRQADPRRDFVSTARPVGYDNLAIVSLVLAIVFAPAALVTAPIALFRMRRTGAQGRGLAITALILVGVLAIALTSGYVIGTRSPVVAH
ncbi:MULTISPECIES: DnaJ domain-containing protein [Catenuloplanes]|uniref:J domain-containing protein n=1 Tax=Catenuloplanes niger TaxID=587534 RepID=A0AAE3ZKV7_9ACTN|nr:DnaJ domain-containing protein [Catenuloplanes niger]MDR7321727.1 hypothetical protein [Catenuloplanes niger]